MPLLDGLRKLALSNGMRRLAHYTDYFTPVLFIVIGVGLLVATFLWPPTDELGLEATLLLGAIGFLMLGLGAWSFWRHSRLDPTVPRKTWTVDDLPLEERAAAVRRLMLLFSAAILVGSGFTLYQLMQLEFGRAQRVTVWAPIALLYDFLGFWPAVLFVPALGLLGIIGMVSKQRAIKAGTRGPMTNKPGTRP
jgi:hypothetical protein